MHSNLQLSALARRFFSAAAGFRVLHRFSVTLSEVCGTTWYHISEPWQGCSPAMVLTITVLRRQILAKHCDTTNRSHFDAAFVDYATSKAAARAIKDHPPCPAQDCINKVFGNAVDAIFAIAAPTLGGVTKKLEVCWGELLFQDDCDGVDWRRMCVGDLRRIEMQLAGIEEAEASGGMDMQNVARNWIDALRQHNHWAQLLAEGPSDRWGHSKQSDILALKDEAEAALLSLPAPHLLAVIKKLETFWTDQRFDGVDNAANHLLIMSDLRRFALEY